MSVHECDDKCRYMGLDVAHARTALRRRMRAKAAMKGKRPRVRFISRSREICS